jgi:hypothetical protein
MHAVSVISRRRLCWFITSAIKIHSKTERKEKIKHFVSAVNWNGYREMQVSQGTKYNPSISISVSEWCQSSQDIERFFLYGVTVAQSKTKDNSRRIPLLGYVTLHCWERSFWRSERKYQLLLFGFNVQTASNPRMQDRRLHHCQIFRKILCKLTNKFTIQSWPAIWNFMHKTLVSTLLIQ